MADNTTIDVLVKMHQVSISRALHINEQRASLTNFMITIAAALLAFIINARFAVATLPLSGFISLLGLFGLLSSVKFNQHYHRYHLEAKLIRERLDELCPDCRLEAILGEAYSLNLQRYPRMEKYVRVVFLWSLLHASIFVIGLICIWITL